MAYNKFVTTQGKILLDLSTDTVTEQDVRQGVRFHGRDGEEYTGILIEVAGIAGAMITEEGDLVLTDANGEAKNLGKVKGDKGEPGEQGPVGATGPTGKQGPVGANGTSSEWYTGTAITGESTTEISNSNIQFTIGDMYLNVDTLNVYKCTKIDNNNKSTWIYTCNIKGKDGVDGINGTDGKDGQNGANGQNGADGRGITALDINDDGELVVTYTDNNTQATIGKVVGSDGKSAYEIWKALPGNSEKSEADFINSLKGEPGKSAYEIWQENGNDGKSETDFLASLKYYPTEEERQTLINDIKAAVLAELNNEQGAE